MSIENKNSRALSDEELARVSGGKYVHNTIFKTCSPEEGLAADRDGGRYITYKCSDPANKGKKPSCSGCPAN